VDIRERALLVGLRIESWTGLKTDNSVTHEVAKNHEADGNDVGKFSKRLIDKKALAEIGKLDGRARQILYQYSHPWDDNGRRIVPTRLWETLSQRLQEVYDERQDAIERFQSNYQRYVNEARGNLGTLFDASDYPSSVKNLFRFRLSYEPVPDDKDFRVDLSAEQVETIKSQAQEEFNSNIAEITKHNIERLKEAVERISSRLKNAPDGKNLHASMIGNLNELLDMIPALNLTNDKKLEALCDDIKESLSDTHIDDLRNDPIVRKNTLGEAERLSKKMAAFFGK
jgi:hypothetical protein